MADPKTDPLDVLSNGPMATLLVVLLNVVGGVLLVIGESGMDFEKYLTVGVASAAALSIGRGLAAKGAASVAGGGFLADFNRIPWATVLVFLYALVGAAVLIIGESDLDFEQYMTLILGAGATLGVGRGIGAYKADRDPIMRPDDGRFEDAEVAAMAGDEGEIDAALPPEASERPEDGPLPEGTVGGFGEHGTPEDPKAREAFRERGKRRG